MPVVTIHGPKIPDIERKRALVKAVTEAAVEAFGIASIVVPLRATEPENVGVNGELVSDRRAQEGS